MQIGNILYPSILRVSLVKLSKWRASKHLGLNSITSKSFFNNYLCSTPRQLHVNCLKTWGDVNRLSSFIWNSTGQHQLFLQTVKATWAFSWNESNAHLHFTTILLQGICLKFAKISVIASTYYNFGILSIFFELIRLMIM